MTLPDNPYTEPGERRAFEAGLLDAHRHVPRRECAAHQPAYDAAYVTTTVGGWRPPEPGPEEHPDDAFEGVPEREPSGLTLSFKHEDEISGDPIGPVWLGVGTMLTREPGEHRPLGVRLIDGKATPRWYRLSYIRRLATAMGHTLEEV